MDDKEKKMAELGRRDFYFLSRGILGRGGSDAMTKQVHVPLCRFLQDTTIQNKLIALPRSFLKSTLACIKLPIWMAINNPNVRVLIACNIIDNAMNHLRSIKHIFERNSLFRHLYPEIIPDIRKVQWSDHSVTVRRTGGYGEATFTAAGVGVNVVGTHYDVIIMDDILTAKKDDVTGDELAPSQLDIDRAIGWYKLAISLFDTPSKGLTFYIGTRWAVHDVIDHILKFDPTFVPYIQNVYKKDSAGKDVFSETGEPIYPERFNAKALAQLKARQGPYIYASQYLLNPLPVEKMVFHPEYIQYFEKMPFNVPYWIYTYVDPAISSKKDACNTAIVTIARTFDNRIYVLECIRKKGMSVSELCKTLFLVHKKYKPRLVGIESVAYQEAIGKHLREQMRVKDYFFNVRDDTPTRDEPKDARIRGMQPRFAAKSVWIKSYMNGLETELLEYQGVERSRYVDAIDALAGAIKISSRPPPPVKTQKLDGITMGSIMEELRSKIGHKLPFGKMLSDMGAPKKW